MGLIEEYKTMEAKRQEEAKKSSEHYKGVNLPGVRSFDNDIEDARHRVSDLKEDASIPHHD